MNDEISPDRFVLNRYRSLIQSKHPTLTAAWPVLTGYNSRIGEFRDWLIIIFTHTGNSVITSSTGIGFLSEAIVGHKEITSSNLESVRARIEKYFGVKPEDGVVFLKRTGVADSELENLMLRHETAMSMAPMKIFLSHKGFDKPMVRGFKSTLHLLGFDPWLDEDAMPAGTSLERGILDGFANSCAAVFFVTPEFKDENYLAAEVEYAIKQKRTKGDKFAIITLVFGEGNAKGTVPDLLHTYVWKEPKSDLEALQEIIRALPIKFGGVRWRS